MQKLIKVEEDEKYKTKIPDVARRRNRGKFFQYFVL